MPDRPAMAPAESLNLASTFSDLADGNVVTQTSPLRRHRAIGRSRSAVDAERSLLIPPAKMQSRSAAALIAAFDRPAVTSSRTSRPRRAGPAAAASTGGAAQFSGDTSESGTARRPTPPIEPGCVA